MTTSNFTETLSDEISFDMVHIEGGEFSMGGMDKGVSKYEKPLHPVKISSFFIGKYPVTQSVWLAIMGGNPSRFNGVQRPLEMVSWEDAQECINRINDMKGKRYRLLSEAEWEFAASGAVLLGGDSYLYA